MQRFLQSDLFYSFYRTPVAVVSFIIVILMVVMAVFAQWIAPQIPLTRLV